MILYLKNFQCHRRLKVDLSQPITVVRGTTDAGKSSIIRAFRWLVTNRPLSAMSLIRHGADSVEVWLRIDGHLIKRIRSKKKNVYIVDGKTLEAFKFDVPAEVQSIVKMGLDNFQSQHDAPYWFAMSPAEVGREINRIVDLSLIDRTITFIKKGSTDLANELKVVNSMHAEKVLQRDTLRDYETALSDHQRIAQIKQHCGELDCEIQQIQNRLQTIGGLKKQITSKRKALSDSAVVMNAWDALYKREKSFIRLNRLLQDLTDLEDSIEAFPTIPQDLQNTAENYDALDEDIVIINGLVRKIDEGKRRICHGKNELENVKRRWKKSMGPICPLCKRRIK